MKRPWLDHDNVAVFGSVVGLLSLLPGWMTFRSSRVVSGVPVNLWTVMGWTAAALMLALWLACLALSTNTGTRARVLSLGILANITLILSLILTAPATAMLLGSAGPFARVSPGPGVWTAILAAGIIIFAVRRNLPDPASRYLVTWLGVAVFCGLLFSGWFDRLSVMQEYFNNRQRFAGEFLRHIALFSGSVAAGAVMGIPLGLWAARNRGIEKLIFSVANITETVPSLALFGLLIAPLSALSFAFPALRAAGIGGIGAAPAVIALTIYSLLPIIRNTYVGLRQVDPSVIDAGAGMGMSRAQVLYRLEAPLAAPLVIQGVRTASVQAVGNTAVAALIGAGGLGSFVFEGLGQTATDLIILGALPIIIIALGVDLLMRSAVYAATPKARRGT